MKAFSEKGNTDSGVATIQAWMVLRISEALGVEPAQIDRQLSFANFGIDSLTAYTLTGDLADWIGRDLPATLFWEYPNIVALSHHLAKALDSQDLNFLHEEMKRVVEEISGLSEDAAQQRLVSVNEQGKKED